MAINIDDTWQHQGGSIYYKDPKRWVCLDCDYDTKSPYGAGLHATSHGIILPNARKMEPVEQPQIQTQIEPKKEEKSQITHNGSTFDEMDGNQNSQPRRKCSKEEYEMWVENQKNSERTQKLLLLMKYKQAGIFTDAELEEKKIEFGLAEREDPKIKIQKQETRNQYD